MPFHFLPEESPRFLLSPGSVTFKRSSFFWEQQAEQRAFERRFDERVRSSGVSEDLEESDNDQPGGKPGRQITEWSAASRANMILQITRLDVSELVSGERPPAMITLTLPGDWLSITPTAKDATACFQRFRKRWQKKFGRPSWIWKREFQRRGAPHWHLWTVPPVDHFETVRRPDGTVVTPDQQFRAWLSETWTDCLRISDPEERRRSLLAGTGIDTAEGLRARDPKRLAIYFLKESVGGEGKAYQNRAPKEWAGQSIGRFWGVSGLSRVAREVVIDRDDADKAWRIVSRLQALHRSPTVTKRVVRGARVDVETGELIERQRTVTRRRRVGARAGWVAVNDGADVGERLARLAWQWRRDRLGVQPVRPGMAARARRAALMRERLGYDVPEW